MIKINITPVEYSDPETPRVFFCISCIHCRPERECAFPEYLMEFKMTGKCPHKEIKSWMKP